MDCIIVGCGLTGSVIARHLAEKGYRVEIWERRSHIGGNMYDYEDENKIMVHKYGPHVFHTYKKSLMDYMLQYGEWVDFPITCKVSMLGKVTPSPFNYQTIDDFYSIEDASLLKSELKKEFPDCDKATIVELMACKNAKVKEYADFLFSHDYSLYTAKQWGMEPNKVDPSILKRVPVLFSYKDGYFDDTWQKVPVNGYTDWFKCLLDHPNIKVRLNVEAKNYLQVKDNKIYIDGVLCSKKVVYTGALDELLNLEYGPLPYRSLRFEWRTEPVKHWQAAALVAYPEAEGYTRITEYTYFPQREIHNKTSLAVEYPLQYVEGEKIEPYYPLLSEESKLKHQKYKEIADKIENLIYCGRLADYKYYNMDQTLENALAKISEITER